MKAKMVAFILLAVLLALAATPVYAQSAPVLPHAFYGTVKINGSPAPVETEVEVRGEGVQTGVGNNPIVTTVDGEYGSAEPLEPKLIVQGDIAEGATLTFYVNGVSTGQTVEWHSGEVTELNLTATISGPPPGATPEPTPEPAPEPTPPESAPEPTPPELTPESAAEPAPPVPPSPPTSPAPPSATESINWPILLAVLGGVAVVGLIILVVATRRSY